MFIGGIIEDFSDIGSKKFDLNAAERAAKEVRTIYFS